MFHEMAQDKWSLRLPGEGMKEGGKTGGTGSQIRRKRKRSGVRIQRIQSNSKPPDASRGSSS